MHKANVLRLTSGLFRDVCREVADEYPDVTVDDFHIDAMTVHWCAARTGFDVIVAENMFGDILSDLAGEIAGSLGIAPSVNFSGSHAMAQAAHGSAPDMAGQDAGNPIAMILSGAMLLEWLADRHSDPRLRDAAARVEQGVTASATGFAKAVVAAIESAAS